MKKKLCLAILLSLALNSSICSSVKSFEFIKYQTLQQARAYIDNGQIKKAQDIITGELSRNPDNALAKIEQARLYIKLDKYSQALNIINKVALYQLKNSDIYSLYSIIYYNYKQYDKAEMSAHKALDLNPKNSDAYLTIGYIYLEKASVADHAAPKYKKYIGECYKDFNQILSFNPNMIEAHIGLANTYVVDNKESKASEELLISQELNLTNPEAAYKLGEFSYNIGEYERAIRFLNKATELNSIKSYKAHFILGNIYEKLGESDKAKEEYSYSIKLKPDYKEANARLKDISSSLIQSDDSTKLDTSYTAQDSDKLNEDEAIAYAEHMLFLSKYKDARDVYRNILKKNTDNGHDNTRELAGLAETYYLENIQGYLDAEGFFIDSQTLDDSTEFSKLTIEKIKFNTVNSDGMADSDKQELIMLSNKVSDDLYDQVDSARASFFLSNYKDSSIKVDKFLDLDDKKKMEIAKLLYFDLNYFEAQKILQSIRENAYQNDADLMLNAIKAKKKYSDSIIEYGQKSMQENIYSDAISRYELAIKSFPSNPDSYIYYAFALDKIGDTKSAIKQLDIYMDLRHLYPAYITKSPYVKGLLGIKEKKKGNNVNNSAINNNFLFIPLPKSDITDQDLLKLKQTWQKKIKSNN